MVGRSGFGALVGRCREFGGEVLPYTDHNWWVFFRGEVLLETDHNWDARAQGSIILKQRSAREWKDFEPVDNPFPALPTPRFRIKPLRAHPIIENVHLK